MGDNVKCPICNNSQLGTPNKGIIKCNGCEATFSNRGNAYKLVGIANETLLAWRKCQNLSFTEEDWIKLRNNEFAVRYNIKTHKYEPYIKTTFSEYKTSYEPPEPPAPAVTPSTASGVIVGAESILAKQAKEAERQMTQLRVQVHNKFRNDLGINAEKRKELIRQTFKDSDPVPESWSQLSINQLNQMLQVAETMIQEKLRGKLNAEAPPDSDEEDDVQDEHEDSNENMDKYFITSAGTFILNVTLSDVLKAYHLLKCFEEGITLLQDELDYLMESDLIDMKE
jgi:hypothetical protein